MPTLEPSVYYSLVFFQLSSGTCPLFTLVCPIHSGFPAKFGDLPTFHPSVLNSLVFPAEFGDSPTVAKFEA